MTLKTGLAFLSLPLFLIAASPAYPFGGPLPYKNQFPLFAHLDTPYIDSARPESSASFGLSYSSVYMVRDSPSWSVGLDMETAELDLRLKKNFHDSLELGVDIPFISFNSGFMDGLLDSYHSAFGFGDYGRSNRPANDFLYTVKKDGRTVIQGEGGRVGPGDIAVSLKKTLFARDSDTLISVKASLELPTGESKRGYGNGSTGAAIALLADKDIGDGVRVYLNLGAAFPGDLRGYERVKLHDYLYAAAAVEAAVFKNLSLVAQAYYEESPYPWTGIATIDKSAVILSLGGRYTSADTAFELAFTEDPSTSGAPDFSLTFAYKLTFR
ncbi:MAG: DUF3187 family protein [Deltaproteobacteria bacterium]|nr:DUF3187 family protein [Deltaproteobacteria bacterium]